MKVIIPTDFSENAYEAIAYVYRNFKHEVLDIALLHTIKQASSSASGAMHRLDDLMMKNAEQEMAGLVSRILADFKGKPEVILRHGYLADWLGAVSRVKEPDLIVMGTKGESNIANKLMGSVTESVVRTSTYPILAIPQNSTMKPLHQVAICTAKDVLPQAKYVATLLSAMNTQNLRVSILRVLTQDNQKVPRSVSVEALEIPVETIRNDNVVSGINEYLKANEIGMLGIYHSHTSRLDYLFNRSITKTICAHVELPLLVMRGE